MEHLLSSARETIARCRALAESTEEPGYTTRSFLSAPMHEVHHDIGGWMREAGLVVSVDAVGNVSGRYKGGTPSAQCLYIGSELHTVPRAGPYDGILGVVIGAMLV